MEYILKELIHTGSETLVVRAAHAKSGVGVVVKLPRDEIPAPRTVEKLRHEYRLLRAVEGPGIIRAVGLESIGQRLALVLEPWGDVALDRLLSDGPLPLPTALRLGASLARTLAAVHYRGIIHRDVKPQNVLVDATRREIRLIDF